jgi:hypothetical protein
MATGGEAAAARLTLYSRAHCHLCEEMLAALRTLEARHPFTVEVIDVDRDPALAERYGEDVPVLAHGAHELCRHRLDAARASTYLEALGRLPAAGPSARSPSGC